MKTGFLRLKKIYLRHISKTYLITKIIFQVKTMFQTFYKQFQHTCVSRVISINVFENPKRGNIRPCYEVVKILQMNHLSLFSILENIVTSIIVAGFYLFGPFKDDYSGKNVRNLLSCYLLSCLNEHIKRIFGHFTRHLEVL